jgi:choline-glycine betaine transporter
MANPDGAKTTLGQWFTKVVDMFTWFYIVANPVLTFFIVWVAYRYGDIKLGAKDAEPEFSNASYFAMIFSAGVGVGLFFFGVSEPLWHSEPDNYYSNAGYHSQNEINQYSLVITLYHWGFAGWSPCKFKNGRDISKWMQTTCRNGQKPYLTHFLQHIPPQI